MDARRNMITRLGLAAAGAAALATGVAASLPAAEAAPLTVTVTGPTQSVSMVDSAGSVSAYTCDLQSPPQFTDPANPDTITNRACSYVDDLGRERSFDPWIDGQLLHAG